MSDPTVQQKIEEIISSRLQSRQDKEEAKKQEKYQIAVGYEKLLEEFLGPDLWSVFKGAGKAEWDDDDRHVFYYLKVPALDDLQLAPIKFTWTTYTESRSSTYKIMSIENGGSTNDLAQGLEWARAKYAEYKAIVLKKAIEEQLKLIQNYYTQSNEDKMLLAYARLMGLDPSQQKEWDEKRTWWYSQRDEKKQREEREAREKEENRKAKEQRAKAFTEYRNVFIEYLKARNGIMTNNKKLAYDIQAAVDIPYQVGKLVYGICATDDESGERYVDTKWVWILNRLDEKKYQVDVDGTVRSYFNPVSLEWMDRKPTQGPLARSITKHGVTIHYPPYMEQGEIEAKLTGLLPINAKPEKPDILSEYDIERAEIDARKFVEESVPVEEPDLNEDEFPF